MVRYVKVIRGGKEAWIPDAPATCPDGHPGPVQTWSQCADCQFACTHWRCREPDCGKEVRDPDHACRR